MFFASRQFAERLRLNWKQHNMLQSTCGTSADFFNQISFPLEQTR